jgi:hypothetical protein
MTWPAQLTDPSYAPSVLTAIAGGRYELEWAPITVGQVQFFINAKPLRIDGVFVNASATLQQQCADALNAILPTPKMMDAAWLGRGATVSPVTLPIASTAVAMVTASGKLDVEMGDSTGCLVCQKTWCITNQLLTHHGMACNYGFPCIPTSGTSWNGVSTEACVSFPSQPKLGRVIQGMGFAHNAQHLDYSQVVWLVHRNCTVDGSARDITDVLTDPALAQLVSHEGVLTSLRQPGVPLISPAKGLKSPGGGSVALLSIAIAAGVALVV